MTEATLPPMMDVLENQTAWLLITSRGYWETLREMGVWAFPEKALSQAEEIQEGDLGIVYLTQAGDGPGSVIAALLQFVGELEEIEPRTFLDKMYPLRRPTEVVHIPDEPVSFRPLVHQMDFIDHKEYWGLHLQGQPLKKLSPDDAQRVITAIEGITL